MTPLHLADKSALEQRRHSAEARLVLETLLVENLLASCHVVALEVLYSARNLRDYEMLQRDIAAIRWIPVSEPVMDRTMEVQYLLAKRGQHRIPLPDLMIAAAAEVVDAVLLHYDSDFDRIAAVTGQATKWIVPRGTAG
ncbi:MAG TPA: PIN domain-containing protein [Microthrixaceae bacterium]|nr:PIN domain-containing protein [Microthrixaceae bacterium]HMT26263.1 PIN domain-containing protein [Microthrixaceae bacterium]HMT62043.1 PIN domain-containing protein [Microthrixaceae bacterium]